MSMIALLLAASVQSGAVHHSAVPLCRAAQLRLTVNNEGFGGMSHDGAELSLRNRGAACRLPTTPAIDMRDARGRVVAHGVPDRSTATIRLGTGRRATIMTRWVSSDVVDNPRHAHARHVAVRIGGGTLTGPLDVTLVSAAGERFEFEQQPAEIAEGMPAG